jgi:hypothetical protein
MATRRSEELQALAEKYASAVAGFEGQLERIRAVDLGEAPLSLETDAVWAPHD